MLLTTLGQRQTDILTNKKTVLCAIIIIIFLFFLLFWFIVYKGFKQQPTYGEVKVDHL